MPDTTTTDRPAGPVTIMDVALAWGAEADEAGGMTGEAFDRLGLPFLGGCEGCEATIAAYNAYPSRSGFLRCDDCVGVGDPDHLGYATVRAFERDYPRPANAPARALDPEAEAAVGALREAMTVLRRHAKLIADESGAACDVWTAVGNCRRAVEGLTGQDEPEPAEAERDCPGCGARPDQQEFPADARGYCADCQGVNDDEGVTRG